MLYHDNYYILCGLNSGIFVMINPGHIGRALPRKSENVFFFSSNVLD